MRSQIFLLQMLSMTLILFVLGGCGAPVAAPVPIPSTALPSDHLVTSSKERR